MTQSVARLDVGDWILMLSDDANRWQQADDALRPLGVSVDRAWSRTVSEAGLAMSVSCLQVADSSGAQVHSVVPVESFTHPANRPFAAAVHVGPGPTLEVQTNRSLYDWQAFSDPIAIEPARDYALEFTAAIDEGGMGVLVVDDRFASLATKFWSSPRPSTSRRIRFRPENGSTIRVVVSNFVPAPRVSRFSLKDMRIMQRPSPR